MLKIDHESVEYGSASKEPGCHLMKRILGLSLLLLVSASTSRAADCNDNGVDDSIDIQTRTFSFTGHESVFSRSSIDLNGDGLNDDIMVISRIGAFGIETEFFVSIQQADGSYVSQRYMEGLVQSPSGSFNPKPAYANLNGFVDLVGFSNGVRLVFRNDGFGNFRFPVELASAPIQEIELSLELSELGLEKLFLSQDVFADRIVMLDNSSFELFVSKNATDETSKGRYELPELGEVEQLIEVTVSAYARDFDRDGLRDLLVIRRVFRGDPLSARFTDVTGYLFKGAEDDSPDRDSRLEVWSETLTDLSGSGRFFIGFPDRNNDGYIDIRLGRSGQAAFTSTIGSTVYLNNADAPFPDKDGNQIPDICQRAIPGDYSGDRISNEVVVRSAFGGLELVYLR